MRPSLSLIAFSKDEARPVEGTWGSLFAEEIRVNDERMSFGEYIADLATKASESAMSQRGDWQSGNLASGYVCWFHQFNDPETGRSLVLEVLINVQVFESLPTHVITNGILNLTESRFWGEIKSPSIDVQSENLGPGWKPISGQDSKENLSLTARLCFSERPVYSANVLRDSMGSYLLHDAALERAARARFAQASDSAKKESPGT